jgi:hypothetical protein
VNAKIQSRLEESKRRIDARLDKNDLSGAEEPMYTASNIQYEQTERIRGISHGGIGSIHLLARQIGLIDAINNHLHVLKIHMPFHESDHVLNTKRTEEPPTSGEASSWRVLPMGGPNGSGRFRASYRR